MRGVITDALYSNGLARQIPAWATWRREGAVLYAQVGSSPSDDDVRVGEMTTADLAEHVVTGHNAILARVQRPEFGKATP